MQHGATYEAINWLCEKRTPEDLDPDHVRKSLKILNARAEGLVEAICRCTGYSSRDAQNLLDAVSSFFTDKKSYAAPRKELFNDGSSLSFAPRGKILCILPSNAIIPLFPILALCSVSAGCATVFSTPAKGRSLAAAVVECLTFNDSFFLLDDSPRAITSTEKLAAFDHVYYMGSSTSYQAIASSCAHYGVSLTFEGQGRSVSVISETCTDCSMQSIADAIMESLTFCNGAMCSTPNHVICSETNFSQFEECLKRTEGRYSLTETFDALLKTSEPTFQKFVSYLKPGEQFGLRPAVAKVDISVPCGLDELYGPAAWLSSYTDFCQASDIVVSNGYRLQVSYFGSNENEIEALSNLPIGRLLVNEMPCYQNPCMPWGNYGLSGYSRTETFRDKFYVPVLIERGMVGALGFEPR